MVRGGVAGHQTHCRIALTDRRGGLSAVPYDTLNLSFGVGDDPGRVIVNRDRLAFALGFSLADMTFAAQVHGIRLQAVEEEGRGRGHESLEDAFPETDALLTGLARTPLVILTADCYAVAVCGLRHVAVAHAGWRGTLGDLPGRCVEALCERGERLSGLFAYLGPGIRDCCYTVDEGRAESFVERYGGGAGVVVRRGHGYRLNLEAANRENLRRAGISAERIISHGGCTACDARFFSYRREGVTGRQALVVWLDGEEG